MKEKVAMIQLTLLGDVNATDLRAFTLIIRAGANHCNTGYENVRKRESGDGEK